MKASLADFVTKGSGLYTAREAACYAEMPVQTLKNWFLDEGNIERVREPQISPENGLYLTFLDLIEAVTIRQLRTQRQVTLRAIREAISIAYNRWGDSHPFGHKDYKIMTNNREIVVWQKCEQNPIEVSGRSRGATYFSEFKGIYDFLEYDGLSPVPALYNAGKFANKTITIDPNTLLGRPRVRGASVSAPALYKAALAEGSDELAAQLYDVDIETVKASRIYCEAIGLAA